MAGDANAANASTPSRLKPVLRGLCRPCYPNKKPGISAGFLVLANQAQGTSLSSSSLSRTAPLSALVASKA